MIFFSWVVVGWVIGYEGGGGGWYCGCVGGWGCCGYWGVYDCCGGCWVIGGLFEW